MYVIGVHIYYTVYDRRTRVSYVLQQSSRVASAGVCCGYDTDMSSRHVKTCIADTIAVCIAGVLIAGVGHCE